MYVTNKTENVDSKDSMNFNIESLREKEVVANIYWILMENLHKTESTSSSKYEKVFKHTHG